MSKRKRAAQQWVFERMHVVPKNESQDKYIRAIKEHEIVFGIGAAGTGKTFLAATVAADLKDKGLIEKIVICRPIVEAGGEELGFLPGDLNEKCDPYIRPVFDGLRTIWDRDSIDIMIRRGDIEISPLAYMRGRTFTNSFVIGDEMQNATEDQMLMLLTRLGQGSKIVVTGDPTQRDRRDAFGLEAARDKLSGCPHVSFIDFLTKDIIRHPVVEHVVRRWNTDKLERINKLQLTTHLKLNGANGTDHEATL